MKISEDLLRTIADLHIIPRRNVYSSLAGSYRSPFRGNGMQFKEFRHYAEGDDIRHMSWLVTARTGHATMKVYEEERELNVILAVDISGSSLFAQGRRRKIDMYADLVATLGLAAVKKGDNVGLLLFNDKPTYFLPPRRARDHVQVALSQLLDQEMDGKPSDLGSALLFAQSVLKSPALIIVLSDFLVPHFDDIARVVSRRHELLLAHCFDDAERGHLKGIFEVRDPETGEFYLLDANSRSTRTLLTRHHETLSTSLKDLCEASRADYLPLSMDENYLEKLVHFFRRRATARS